MDSICHFLDNLSSRDVKKKDIDHKFDSDDDSDEGSDDDSESGEFRFDKEKFDSVHTELKDMKKDNNKIPKVNQRDIRVAFTG